jgi:hypothetical protein
LCRPGYPALRGVVKAAGGIYGLARQICKQGASDLSEFELVGLITEYAKSEHPALSDAAAFSKVFTDATDAGVLLRRAIGVCKGYPLSTDNATPDSVGGQGALDDDTDALAELQGLALELQRRSPGKSFAQCFAEVCTDPRNAGLAARERRQHRPTGVERA